MPLAGNQFVRSLASALSARVWVTHSQSRQLPRIRRLTLPVYEAISALHQPTIEQRRGKFAFENGAALKSTQTHQVECCSATATPPLTSCNILCQIV